MTIDSEVMTKLSTEYEALRTDMTALLEQSYIDETQATNIHLRMSRFNKEASTLLTQPMEQTDLEFLGKAIVQLSTMATELHTHTTAQWTNRPKLKPEEFLPYSKQICEIMQRMPAVMSCSISKKGPMALLRFFDMHDVVVSYTCCLIKEVHRHPEVLQNCATILRDIGGTEHDVENFLKQFSTAPTDTTPPEIPAASEAEPTPAE